MNAACSGSQAVRCHITRSYFVGCHAPRSREHAFNGHVKGERCPLAMFYKSHVDMVPKFGHA